MLKIRCTSLEDVRQNPKAYAQLLANFDAKKSGGTRGMFTHWKEVAKKVLKQELSIPEGVKELQKKFIQFDDTPKNKARQDKLLEQFVNYCRQFDKNKFAFIDGHRRMQWELYAEVMLTGLTPIVVHNDEGYYSYLPVEQPFDWQSQLRFPLIQQYLADYNIDCDVTEMNMGIYCLANGKFEFHSFSKKELHDAVIQTSSLFESVYKEYQNIKKTIVK